MIIEIYIGSKLVIGHQIITLEQTKECEKFLVKNGLVHLIAEDVKPVKK